jgi:hypothetical protein
MAGLFFFGIAFSQDSSLVELPKDSVAMDTISIDTTLIDSIPVNTVPLDTALADSVKIKPGLHFFISVGAQFINFNDRARFQALLEASYNELLIEYNEDGEGSYPLKQDFQNVNLAFPITVGIVWQFNDWHSLGIGTGFIYNNESVILTDKHSEVQNFRYALRAFPLFAEYRLSISPDLISLRNGDYFSLFLRYYWMLPGTEVYSSWGTAKADLDILGNGFGVFLGYRFWDWEGFSIWGELGFLSLDVESGNKEFMPNSWNLGGISILIRAMF